MKMIAPNIADADHEADHAGHREDGVAEQPQRQDRLGGARLPQDERDEQHDADATSRPMIVLDSQPIALAAPDEGEQQRADAATISAAPR